MKLQLCVCPQGVYCEYIKVALKQSTEPYNLVSKRMFSPTHIIKSEIICLSLSITIRFYYQQ